MALPRSLFPRVVLQFASFEELLRCAPVSSQWRVECARTEFWALEALRLHVEPHADPRDALRAWWLLASRWDARRLARLRGRPFSISVAVRMKPPSAAARPPAPARTPRVPLSPLPPPPPSTGEPAAQPRPRGTTELSPVGLRSVEVRRGTAGSTLYSYDRVLGPSAGQGDVFAAVARRSVYEVLQGVDSTVFVYGQTGAGKTYSMLGPGGIAQQAFEMLWRRLDGQFTVRMAFEEVYNERIFDLLGGGCRMPPPSDDALGRSPAGGASLYAVDSPRTMLNMLERGQRQRHTFATKMNARSSRAHALVRVLVRQRAPRQLLRGFAGGVGELESVLCLVDLAGSERIKRSGAEGDRLLEAKHINLSLTTLQRCVACLAAGGEGGVPSKTKKKKKKTTEAKRSSVHVPYRDSILTRMMQPSFGGNGGRTSMLVCASSDEPDAAESVSSLRFGQQAATVKLEADAPMTRDRGSRPTVLDEMNRLSQLMDQMAAVFGAGRVGVTSLARSASKVKKVTDLPLYQRHLRRWRELAAELEEERGAGGGAEAPVD